MLNDSETLSVEELKEIYKPVEKVIKVRLDEFRQVWARGCEEELFRELVFCMLTPQSKARICWNAVQRLYMKTLISTAQANHIRDELIGVRFNKRKAEYICIARATFKDRSLHSTLAEFSDPFSAREWLAENIMGLGYKESSHFLRNIGLGVELAILDRHILKNLKLLGIIHEFPTSLSKKTYLKIEQKMTSFSIESEIPMGQLDLLLWYKEAGEVFK